MDVTLFFLRHGPAIALTLAAIGAAMGPWAQGAWAWRRARRQLASRRAEFGEVTAELDAVSPGERAVVEGEWVPSGERGVHGVVRTARGDVRVVGEPLIEAGHIEWRVGLRARLVDAQLVAGRRVIVTGTLRRGSVRPEGYRDAKVEHELGSTQVATLAAVADGVVRLRRDLRGVALASVLGCALAMIATRWVAEAAAVSGLVPQPMGFALSALSGDYLHDARRSYAARLRGAIPASAERLDETAEAVRLAHGERAAVATLLSHGQYRRAAWAARRASLVREEAIAWYALGDFRRASDAYARDLASFDLHEVAVHVLARQWSRALATFEAREFDALGRPPPMPLFSDHARDQCVSLALRARMDPQGALRAARTVLAQRSALNRGREPAGEVDAAWWSCPRVVLDTIWRAGGSAQELSVALSAGREESIDAAARALLTRPAEAFVGRAVAVDLDADVGGARAASIAAVRAGLDAYDLAPQRDGPPIGVDDAVRLRALRAHEWSDERDRFVDVPGLRAEIRWGPVPRAITDLPSRRLGALHHRRAVALAAGDPALAREVDGILRRYVHALMDRDVATVIWFLENR